MAASTSWDRTKALVSTTWDGTKIVASAAWNGTKTVASTMWNGTKTVVSTVSDAKAAVALFAWDAGVSLVVAAPKTPADFWDRGTTWVQYAGQFAWRRARDPIQAVRDDLSLTTLAEGAVGSFQILEGDAELYNTGNYCGNAGECLQGGFTPVDSEGNGQAITIGHTVTFPSDEFIEPGWIEHEFTHVLQYEIMGGVFFGLDYGAEQLWGVTFGHKSKEEAYWDQSTEQWARAVQKDPNYEPGQNPLGHWFEDANS